MTQLLLGIAPVWNPTLENLVPGRNVELISALRHALSGSSSERCVYIWGEHGCGKTHVLQAVVRHAKGLGLDAVYASAAVPEVARVVAVDNAELLGEQAQVALFELYNRQRESGGMLLVSGVASPAHLQVRDDLRTRLGWGLVYQIHALNDDEKSAALEQHALARGFELPQEVTHYLLRHGRRDLSSLLSILDELDAHCLRLKRLPTVPLLKEVMARGG